MLTARAGQQWLGGVPQRGPAPASRPSAIPPTMNMTAADAAPSLMIAPEVGNLRGASPHAAQPSHHRCSSSSPGMAPLVSATARSTPSRLPIRTSSCSTLSAPV